MRRHLPANPYRREAAPSFGEATFAFTVLHELAVLAASQGQKLWLPFLPTPWQEASLGYDARVLLRGGLPLYLQFKLSRRRFHARGRYFDHQNTHPHPPYQDHYLQFDLHPTNRNSQWRALRTLAAMERHVYYCAPDILSQEQFLDVAHMGKMTEWSRLFPLSEFPPLDVDQSHCVTFQHWQSMPPDYPVASLEGLVHSDPASLPSIRLSDLSRLLDSKEGRRSLDIQHAFTLARDFSRDADRGLRKAVAAEYPPLNLPEHFWYREAARILQVNHGVTLALVLDGA